MFECIAVSLPKDPADNVVFWVVVSGMLVFDILISEMIELCVEAVVCEG